MVFCKVFVKEYLALKEKITVAPQAKKMGFRKVFVKNNLLETTLYTSAPQAKNFFQAIRFNRNCYQINFSKKGVCTFEKKFWSCTPPPLKNFKIEGGVLYMRSLRGGIKVIGLVYTSIYIERVRDLKPKVRLIRKSDNWS